MINLNQLLDSGYWSSLISSPGIALFNLLDLLLVIFLLYRVSQAIVGTKIMTLIRGVFLFLLAQVVASLLGLQTISWLINQVITYGVIAGVVIFAPELRSVLEKLGRSTHIFIDNSTSTEEALIQSCLKSVKYMSPRKIGALVAIEQARTLQEYRSTGISLNADVSGELLINIFIPNTPLHDGGVIIKDNKITVSCAYFPLTDNTDISKEFGTRHRAAIGLSEVSDAFVFVVSEETGAISIAHNGVFEHNLSLEKFEEKLRRILVSEETKPRHWWQKIGG